jgi:wyosine [tRNA(Phe)-imidazoG37] synthetase (radical SAM superfamily)
LTNGTLLYREDVRADCSKADVVMPSLDAGDEKTFQRINRPDGVISIEKLISGLSTFRKEFTGQIWLEVFIVEGINTDVGQIADITKAIELINPDKIQLNTAVRPTSDPYVKRLSVEKLKEIASQFGPKCEVVADFFQIHSYKLNSSKSEDTSESKSLVSSKAESLLSMLKRRPCSLNDICAGLGISQNEARKHISDFQHRGVILSDEIDGIVFFKAIS